MIVAHFVELSRKLRATYFISAPRLIWNEFASFWFSISGKREDLTLQEVLLGKLDTGTELLNYFITLIKLHIWISRKHGVTPNFNVFKEIIKVKFRTEKINTECKFRARW